MSTKRRKKSRNGGAVSIGIIVMAFLVIMTFQIVKIKDKNENIVQRKLEKQQEYEAETERANELQEYEEHTKTIEYIEELAKSKLGLVYDNEIVYKESGK